MSPPAFRRSPLVVLFLTVFIDLMGFGIVIPLLPAYAERLHATPFVAGSLVGIYSLMQLVFAPVWGALSDRLGRRIVLLVSLAGSAVSYLMLGVAWSIAMLFAARVLAGVACANIAVAQAYIADVTPPNERARGMGLIGAAFGLGMVIGPGLGAGLALFGPRVPELFAVFFLVTLGFAVLEGTFPLAAERLFGYGESRIYGLFVYMGLVAVVVQGWLVGRLTRRVSEPALVVVGAAGLGLGLAWVPFTGGSVDLLLALALVVTGQGLAGPPLSSLISKTAGGQTHGEVLGVSQSLSAAARALGPHGGGLALERVGASPAYVAAALCALGACGLALPLGRRTERPASAPGLPLRRSG